jgi:hypothetical protein
MAYIEENMKARRRLRGEDVNDLEVPKQMDPREELYRITTTHQVSRGTANAAEGSVTNSMAMLTAIPEVDLGMELVFNIFPTHRR